MTVSFSISIQVSVSALPVIIIASQPAFLSRLPNEPPQFEDVRIPVRGDTVEMLKRVEEGESQRVRGPVVITIQLSSSNAFMPGRM